MGGLSPWHWLILILVGLIVGGVILVVTLTRNRPPAPMGVPPGWYPDPQDPALERFFDGRGWTPQTRGRPGPGGSLR